MKHLSGVAIQEQPARQPVSGDIVHFAQSLANRAQALAERVNGKLHPVMVSACPRGENPCCKESVEYPPLFVELRANFQGIEEALETIEYAISRTEL